MGNSSLKHCQHHESTSIDSLLRSYNMWNDVGRKMRIEVNSYTERNDQFWRDMLTRIGEAMKKNRIEMEVSLIGISITPVGTILVTNTDSPSSLISTLNTAKICITLHETPEARQAVFAAVDAINEKFNEHDTELTEFMVLYGIQVYKNAS